MHTSFFNSDRFFNNFCKHVRYFRPGRYYNTKGFGGIHIGQKNFLFFFFYVPLLFIPCHSKILWMLLFLFGAYVFFSFLDLDSILLGLLGSLF